MEVYRNMNVSNDRNCRNTVNPGCRNQMNPGCAKPTQNCSRPMQNCNQTGRNVERPMQNCVKESVQEQRSRGVEVECVCKVRDKKNCHRMDEMESLSKEFPTVMAYVPWQQWGEMYDAECGLMQGTLFKEMNLIFCGVRC